MPVLHAHTPTLSVLDARALPVRTVSYWRADAGETVRACINRTVHDVAGRAVAQWDPRLHDLHTANPTVPPNLATVYSLSGQILSTQSVDAGLRVQLFGETGLGVHAWDGRGTHREVQFDLLLRPLAVFEQDLCTERFSYGGFSAGHNQCGQIIRHDDPAGTRHFGEYSMGGAVLDQVQHFLQRLDMPNWPASPDQRDDLLEPGDGARTLLLLNALGEVLQQTDTAGNQQGTHYTVDGQRSETWVQLNGSPVRKTLSSAITYSAQGRIERKTLGNGVVTQLDYGPQDGRLLTLYSSRGSSRPLQDLQFDYDPVGNIVSIKDRTLPVRFFANQQIDPISRYTYDSLDQLSEASGFEAGSARQGPNHWADSHAVANFRQTYRYDLGGNLLELIHHGPQSHGRVLRVAQYSNRCLPEGDVPPTEADIAAAFDANGNLLQLRMGGALSWNPRNQLAQTRSVERKAALDDTERYLYGADGMRQRKIRTAHTNVRAVMSETRYLPGLEIRNVDGHVLHVISIGEVQVLHWETPPPKGMANNQYRYNLEDHLGSWSLEMDGLGRVVCWENYHPFGSTAFWARGESSEESYRTLGYSGKERDASGLYYHGHRYFIPWLQRWLSPDPGLMIDGPNLYAMVRNNPTNLVDDDGLVGKRKYESTLLGPSSSKQFRYTDNVQEAPKPRVTSPRVRARDPESEGESESEDPNVLYRALRADETKLETRGLRPPIGHDRFTSAYDHVHKGSSSKVKSRWISASRSIKVAGVWAAEKELKVVKFSKPKNAVSFDLTTDAGWNALLDEHRASINAKSIEKTEQMVRNSAKSSQEVVTESYVPPEGILEVFQASVINAQQRLELMKTDPTAKVFKTRSRTNERPKLVALKRLSFSASR
ncbi:RHS repeat domain-containing protein [Pseudomonas sp. CBZ-4]|uniref:RHS repeat domain-containing protein n=1 Tax=Pseudomonas sp. CBZ-4 TaxID=1163065 RepID=UPI0003456C5C|nr:RHS repeat-associated core domain-containing protein [Pseudomonas sp. CBZ-4]